MAEEPVGSMPVSAFVADEVARIDAGASLLEVADALAGGEVGLLAIVEGQDVRGVVSERDVVRALAKRLPPDSTTAADIASTKLVWCDASASVTDVATEMLEQYVRHVLVEDGGALVGIVSARDLLGVYASADADEG